MHLLERVDRKIETREVTEDGGRFGPAKCEGVAQAAYPGQVRCLEAPLRAPAYGIRDPGIARRGWRGHGRESRRAPVRLTRVGHWGNLSHCSIEERRRAVAASGRGREARSLALIIL